MRNFQRFVWIAVHLIPTVLGEAAATGLEGLPDCSVDCYKNITSSSPCLANEACICEDDSVRGAIRECASQNCSTKDMFMTMNVTLAQCGDQTHSQTAGFEIVAYTLGAFSTTLVALRIAFKRYAGLIVGRDDWAIVGTAVTNIVFSIALVHELAAHGLGHDIWNVPHDDIYSFGKYYFTSAMFYFVQSALIKLTFLFFFLRIFPSKPLQWTIWITFAITALYGLVFSIISIFFQCKPISYFWTEWDGEHTGRCMNRNALAWSHAAIGIALDIWVLGIPLLQIRVLNMHWKKKIGVALMFCVGAFATIVSILRLQSLVRFGFKPSNPTKENFSVLKWSIVEMNVGIVCNCMPTVRLILVRIFPRLGGSHQRYVIGRRNDGYKCTQTRNPFGNTASVQTSGRCGEMKENGITRQNAYTVEFGESDEIELVRVPNNGE